MRNAIAFASALLASCQVATAAVGPSEPAPDALPSITLEQLQVAGGTPWLHVVAFDSASLSFVSRTCPNRGDIAACPAPVTATGRAAAQPLTEVFRLVNSSAGRNLRATYMFDGGVRPPDAAQFTLTVVSNGRRWRVQWDPRAPHPSVLRRAACQLEVARGSLALCNGD
jgi:hypothetical protein